MFEKIKEKVKENEQKRIEQREKKEQERQEAIRKEKERLLNMSEKELLVEILCAIRSGKEEVMTKLEEIELDTILTSGSDD